MKSQFDLATSYLAKVPAPSSGARNNELNTTAFMVVERFKLSEFEFTDAMGAWASTFAPRLSDAEVRQTLSSAWNAGHSKGVAGSKARAYTEGAHRPSPTIKPVLRPPTPQQHARQAPSIKYDFAGKSKPLPPPIPDGTRALLNAVFGPGEGIRITPADLDDNGREVPDSGGITFTREEWLRRLGKSGNPNEIFSSTKRTGIYIGINPYRVGGTKDADVTSFRHALVEFDHGISPEEQFLLYQQSRLPCAAVIYSGGKSVHAWVKIDAKDRNEYNERVATLYAHFQSAGLTVDIANKNPGRLSRLPNCERFKKRQELLALGTGCNSWTEWVQHIDADGLGRCERIDDLAGLDIKSDPNCVIGIRDGKTLRYLCRGKSLWLIGPSGIGKSSLITEFAVGWAQGLPVFGITPAKPIKSLIVQAENDQYDLAEMVQGICSGHNLNAFTNEEQFDIVNDNLLFRTETRGTGQQFIDRLHRLIDRERPDIVWIDPLLSFAGINVSEQSEVSQFLREGLNPMLDSTGVILCGVHHTGKPKAARDTANWTAIDWAYSGLGSSELVNWARAVMVLCPISEYQFELKLAKRGRRAGATHPDGSMAHSVFLQHGRGIIRWEQIEPPKEPTADESKEAPSRAPGRPHKEWNMTNFLQTVGGEKLTRSELKSRCMAFGEFSDSHFEHNIWKTLKDYLEQEGKAWKVRSGPITSEPVGITIAPPAPTSFDDVEPI